jgi:uncharacterized integral membrane protein (TIGR00698 family)
VIRYISNRKRRQLRLKQIKLNWKGVALCLAIALPAWYLGRLLPLIGGPVFSILIGAFASAFIKNRNTLNPGISFTSKKILQYAVILLGFGMNLSLIVSTGLKSLPIIIITIASALTISFAIFKIFNLPTNISILVGVGSSICGGSAIAATAPVIDAKDDEIATAISVIFFFNVIAALLFPSLGNFLGLSDYGFGLFAGTAINDTSSVTAAATSWDALHGSDTLGVATVVKLTRTLAIIPITIVLALYQVKTKEKSSGDKIRITSIFPFFILYFLLASTITTLGLWMGLSINIFSPLKSLSKFLIVMAMAAIGLNTNIPKLLRSGLKPLLMGLCCWIGIAITSLLMQHWLGIW